MFTHLVALFSSIPFFSWKQLYLKITLKIIHRSCTLSLLFSQYLYCTIPSKVESNEQDYYLPIDANFSYHANDIHI
jgi:hypothetical protein